MSPKQPTQLELDHLRLLKQEHALRKNMGKQRINQLKKPNGEEDKNIRKLVFPANLNIGVASTSEQSKDADTIGKW